MAYANLASSVKLARTNQIIDAIGANGLMNIYTGSYPGSPDITPTGTLLASLPLSAPAGTASLAVQGGIITDPGTGGTDGTYNLTVSGGGGNNAAGIFIVSGGSLSTIALSNNGHGYVSPPDLAGFSNAGLFGASATSLLTGVLVFNPITTRRASASGLAGFVRITTAGGDGILDLDIGTSNAFSVVIDNAFIIAGQSIGCSAEVLIES